MHLKIKTHKKKNKNTSKCYGLILRKYFINQNTVTKMQGMNQVVKHNSVLCLAGVQVKEYYITIMHKNKSSAKEKQLMGML